MAHDLTATVRSFFDDWSTRDPDVLTSYFAEEGTWTEANRATATGHEAIRAVMEVQVGFGSEFSFEFRTIEQVGNLVFTERIDRFLINGGQMVVPVLGVMEFDGDGKIEAWRDYYDWSALEQQLLATGIDMSGAE